MAISYYDPTDHHPVPAPQRPLYATGAELLQARIARGICSDPDCGLPIDGWCIGCRAKLCERHLRDHHNQHSREYLHAQTAQTEELDELDELDVRPVCERCHTRKAPAEMDWLSVDGVDWFACQSCRDAYDRAAERSRL